MSSFAFPHLAQCADSVFGGNPVRAVCAFRFRHFDLQKTLRICAEVSYLLTPEKEKDIIPILVGSLHCTWKVTEGDSFVE